MLAEREPAGLSGEVLYVLDRYLRERGDKNIKNVADLISQSTFYHHATIAGVTIPPKTRLEGLINANRAVHPEGRRRPACPPDACQQSRRQRLARSAHHAPVLVNQVMADQKLDALVYPTKTVPAPLLAAPVEPTNIKVVKDTVTVTIDGETYERTVDRVIEVRPPLTWRLSPNGGFPTIAVPAGFHQGGLRQGDRARSRWRQDVPAI